MLFTQAHGQVLWRSILQPRVSRRDVLPPCSHFCQAFNGQIAKQLFGVDTHKAVWHSHHLFPNVHHRLAERAQSRRGHIAEIQVMRWGNMQNTDYIRAQLVCLFHFPSQELLTHQLIEWLEEKGVETRQQFFVERAIVTVEQVGIDGSPVRPALGYLEWRAAVRFCVLPLDQDDLPSCVYAFKHHCRVCAGKIGPSGAFAIAGDFFAEIVFLPYPFEGDKLPFLFQGQNRLNRWEGRSQKLDKGTGFIGEWEQKVGTAGLRITQMVAGSPVLPIVPFDFIGSEIGCNGLADLGEEIFLSARAWQAEWARLASIYSVCTCRIGKIWRYDFECSLASFFDFKECSRLAPLCLMDVGALHKLILAPSLLSSIAQKVKSVKDALASARLVRVAQLLASATLSLLCNFLLTIASAL